MSLPAELAARARDDAVAEATSKASALKPLLDELSLLAAEWVSAPMARVSLVDDTDDTAVVGVGQDEQLGASGPAVTSLCATVADRDRPVVIADLQEVLGPAHGPGAEVRSYLGVPLRVSGHVVGALCVGDDAPREWTTRDIEVLSQLSRSVSRLLTPAFSARRPDDLRERVRVVGVLRVARDLAVLAAAGQIGPRAAQDVLGRYLPATDGVGEWPREVDRYRVALSGATVCWDLPSDDGRAWSVSLEPVGNELGTADELDVRFRVSEPLAPRSAAPGRPERDEPGVPDPDAPVPALGGSFAGDPAAVLAALQEGVVLFDQHEKIVAVNAAARRLLGLVDGSIEEVDLWRRTTAVRDLSGRLVDMSERGAATVLATGEPALHQTLIVERATGDVVLRVNYVPLPHGTSPTGGGVLASLSDMTELWAAEAAARHQADRDPLTSLPNRAMLVRVLEEAMLLARAHGGSVAVLVIDLDDFKAVNDAYGHNHGDQYLLSVGERFTEMLPAGATLARVGGDEFVLLHPSVSEPAGVTELGGRLLTALAEPLVIHGVEHVAKASVGIALARYGFGTAEDLLGDADLAMYQAKASGGSTTCRFLPEMRLQAQTRARLERELRRAVVEGELRLHYQPIFDAASELVSFEALVRWEHPVQGLLGPGTFVPIAEDSGLIVTLGDWVLDEACRQSAAWRALHGDATPPIQVNVSAAQLADLRLATRVTDLLERYHLPSRALALEVTETMVMNDLKPVATTIDALTALGVHLALDDFGTGYSSLGRLAQLPISTLKIDRSFISGTAAETKHAVLVASMCDLARRLGVSIVAEGVETQEQRQALLAVGCDLFQGFLLGRPEPPQRAALLLGQPRPPR